MRRLRTATTAALLALALGGVAVPHTLAAEPSFGVPSATATLGQPLTISSQIEGVENGSVDVLVGLVGKESRVALPAAPGPAAGEWQVTRNVDVATSNDCTCVADGNSAPNTQIEFQFRVRAADGTSTLGPVGQVTVEDNRFEWRTLEQDLVRVHWYEGDDAFAQSAADVANEAIDHAAELMGQTLPEPVDLFVYSSQQALLEAVSPNRENIAGEAHSTIGTMFVWLPPDEDPERKAVIVAHELTHLVFNEVTDNPYHGPPRWLNEGIAVYLSEGYGVLDQLAVTGAAANGSLIPLEGLAGFFPSPVDQFSLAYSESVSAVDFFIKRYGEQALWDLVRSYADGQSDDDAFINATGADVAVFNSDWFGYLGAQVPVPFGPQPAPPGPVPSSWQVEPTPSSGPDPSAPAASPRPQASRAPARSVPPARPPAGGGGSGALFTGIAFGTLAFVLVIALVLVVQISRRRRPYEPVPPPPWQTSPPPWQQPPYQPYQQPPAYPLPPTYPPPPPYPSTPPYPPNPDTPPPEPPPTPPESR